MNKLYLMLFTLLILGSFASHAIADNFLPGRIYIKFKPGFEQKDLHALTSGIVELDFVLNSVGVSGKRPLMKALKNPDPRGLKRIFEFTFPDDTNILKLIGRIEQIEGVEYAEPHYLRKTCGGSLKKNSGYSIESVPNDPYFALQWGLEAVDAVSAWDVVTGNAGVVIAIVDNGVDLDHPDLETQIWINPDEIDGNGVDDDNNGYIDDYYGWDFVDDNNDPNPNLDAGNPYHGTHVAGIAAAATENGRGIAGMAPDCKIMAVQSGEGDIIYNGAQGIIYASENGADVINLSWGGYDSYAVEEDAIASAIFMGKVVVAAAGNDNTDQAHYPSGYENVIGVASINPDNAKSSFSNYGFEIDVSAPGNSIYSTIVNEAGQPGYAYLDGTSMSAPLVSGIASLVLDANPGWSNAKVAIKLVNSCDNIDDHNPGYEGQLGAGRINAYHAAADLMPGLKISSIAFSDEFGGDDDGIPEPGETIQLNITLDNKFQDATAVEAELTTTSPNATVVQGTASYGDMFEGSSKIQDVPFEIELGSVSEGEKINLDLGLSTGGGFDLNLNFYIVALPPYASHTAGNVVCTFTNFGALGYQDNPYFENSEFIGEGFRYMNNGVNALYHGSMVLGTSAGRVCASIYREDIDPYEFEWTFDEYIAFYSPGDIADQETFATYYDHEVFTTSSGAISVEQRTYAWSDEAVEDFVIVEFKYKNNTDSTLSAVYSGLFMDWDIGNYTNNSVGYNSTKKTGYMFANGSLYYGISALSDEVSTNRAINNAIYTSTHNLTDNFLYSFMSGASGIATGSGADFSQLLSVGPFILLPDEEKTVVFAILAGDDLEDYLKNVDAADSLYNLNFGTESINSSPLNNISLSFPSPNPFNMSVNFVLELKNSNKVNLKIFDVLGRETASIFNGYLQAGVNRFSWNSGNAASGTYFIRAKSGDETQMRKVILIK